MKSRSHRLPTSVPTTDDWVDGSWTVDCVCGVNFDDGEEMVNCDECGVWVHTRCSRYVKSEKSFACDKCKSKNSRNDSEETEVAQLLVELPTKTLRMDNPSQVSGHPRRPFRLWTDMPMEERVHVQGIPGGEPALFGGLSTVFTPELWKCTGYVPKKFNFQYREFPCWDEEQEVNGKIEEDGENPVDKGAGVLFSLSKENVLATPVATLMGMKRQAHEYGRDRSAPSKDIKKWGGENIGSRCPQNGIKKDRTLLRPSVIHSNKRQKEDSGTSKDRSGKKKAKVADRDGDPKKRAPQASKTEAKELETHKGVGSKIVKINAQKSIKNADLSDTLPTIDPLPGGHDLVENNLGKPELNFASGECHPAEARASDASRNKFSGITRPMEGKAGHQVSPRSQSSLITDDCLTALLEHKEPGSVPAKEQVAGIPENVNNNGGSSSVTSRIDPLKSEPLVDNFGTVVAEGKDNRKCREPSVDLCPRSIESGAKVKTEAELQSSEGTFCFESRTPSVLKLDGTKPLAQQSGASADQLYENDKTDGSAVTSLHSSDVKLRGIDRAAKAASNCQTDGEFPSDHRQPKRQGEGSKRSIAVGKSSSELKHDSAFAEEPTNISCTSVIPPAPPCQHKVAVSSSASSTTVISKPPISDNFRPLNAQNQNPTAKQGVSDCSITVKKDEDSTSVVFNEERHEVPRKILKERPKSSFNSTPKATHSGKISPTSDSKKTLSESKDSVPYTSSTQFLGVASGSGEHSSLLQFPNAPNAQNKISASDIQPRGEKINQSNSQSSTRVNHTTLMHHPAPSKSPSTLSDEELALLLHHELNSSPRVPRVPRMRHTGSFPQLGSPTAAASMLIKRTSSSGGKDHSVVAKRKNKDLPKDKSRSTHDIDDEAKMDRLLPPSPDPGRHDSACATGAFSKRGGDSGSGKGVHAIKKIAPSVSTTSVSTGPSSSNEANEQNLSYMQNSPRNASDDDTGTIGVPSHQTLPGLIAEIMSTGQRMSYEELCNAVLPHWPNLRKHNGERYAYSSHSQAVLDCLRNRHEWAQLVDRGPKTNAGRKRRKLDAEAPSFESEDAEYGQDTTVKAVENKSFESHRDEFPKGKRKARKRRRLALQGRGIKDVRRQQRLKADELSDDDAGSFSSSSEDSMFSDDEIQGGRTCPVGSEASTSSSDEMGTVS